MLSHYDKSLLPVLTLFYIMVNSNFEKGNALMGLGRFDEAKVCYESLHSLQECIHDHGYFAKAFYDFREPRNCCKSKRRLGDALADTYLKKLHDAQERVENKLQVI